MQWKHRAEAELFQPCLGGRIISKGFIFIVPINKKIIIVCIQIAFVIYKSHGKQINISYGQGVAAVITMNGNDLYVAGYSLDTACYWKNGNNVSISDYADIYDIKFMERMFI